MFVSQDVLHLTTSTASLEYFATTMKLNLEGFFLVATSLLLQRVLASPLVVTVMPLSIPKDTASSTVCPETDAARQNLSNHVRNELGFVRKSSTIVSECGNGIWYKIAHLNMSEPTAHCPSVWKEYSTPVRTCGRHDNSDSSCSSKIYNSNGYNYCKVCGRAIGYRYGYTDGFNGPPVSSPDDIYVEGLSITHGNQPRTHIWTYAAGNSEINSFFSGSCPCAGGNGVQPPTFVGDNYHCESGYSGQWDPGVVFLTGDPLWDGIRCEGRCCTDKSPPWFSITLPVPSSDDIEVRICGHADGEDTPIKMLEIYLQ